MAKGGLPSSLWAAEGAHHLEYAQRLAQEIPPLPLDAYYCRDPAVGTIGSRMHGLHDDRQRGDTTAERVRGGGRQIAAQGRELRTPPGTLTCCTG